jgi:hypothetical protein
MPACQLPPLSLPSLSCHSRESWNSKQAKRFYEVKCFLETKKSTKKENIRLEIIHKINTVFNKKRTLHILSLRVKPAMTKRVWIPAFAGTTKRETKALHLFYRE